MDVGLLPTGYLQHERKHIETRPGFRLSVLLLEQVFGELQVGGISQDVYHLLILIRHIANMKLSTRSGLASLGGPGAGRLS
jgi:hypothetical protein